MPSAVGAAHLSVMMSMNSATVGWKRCRVMCGSRLGSPSWAMRYEHPSSPSCKRAAPANQAKSRKALRVWMRSKPGSQACRRPSHTAYPAAQKLWRPGRRGRHKKASYMALIAKRFCNCSLPCEQALGPSNWLLHIHTPCPPRVLPVAVDTDQRFYQKYAPPAHPAPCLGLSTLFTCPSTQEGPVAARVGEKR